MDLTITVDFSDRTVAALNRLAKVLEKTVAFPSETARAVSAPGGDPDISPGGASNTVPDKTAPDPANTSDPPAGTAFKPANAEKPYISNTCNAAGRMPETEIPASAESAPPKPSAEPNAAAEDTADTPIITNEALRAVAVKKEKKAMKELLVKYAVGSLTAVPAEARPAFLADMQGLADKAA